LTWTDLHSHILPGCDDGASSDEEFLEMSRIAVEGGTSLMAATPPIMTMRAPPLISRRLPQQ
jgi:tyrosine-protein phosphatase YwqE